MEERIEAHIQEVLEGKTSSFAFLVDNFKNLVFTVCFRILRNTDDAEDAAQVTFIKAFNNLHTFTFKSKFSTWLYTIAFRTAVSQSKVNIVETVSVDYLADIESDWDDSTAKDLERKDQKIFVQKAIEELTEVDGVLITLFYIEECSIQEIAQITDMSESNVKVRLFRARKQLKLVLKDILQEEMHSIRS